MKYLPRTNASMFVLRDVQSGALMRTAVDLVYSGFDVAVSIRASDSGTAVMKILRLLSGTMLDKSDEDRMKAAREIFQYVFESRLCVAEVNDDRGPKGPRIAAEISCWGEWFQSILTQGPGLYFVAGLTGSGKSSVLDATKSLMEGEGRRVIDGAGIVEIDGMLDGLVVLHGEVREVSGLQRAFDLARAGAIVLCSIHATDVRSALHRIMSPVLGGTLDIVGPRLRSVMAQVLVEKYPEGGTCLNEISVFKSVSDVQMVLDSGPLRTLRHDADSKLAAGILTRESVEQADLQDCT